MFQPETEDMLPRMAPKPNADNPNGATERMIRPQVPEVSILFGQQDNNRQLQSFNPTEQQNNKFSQQTYAAWKKQILPKVAYSSSANIVDTQLPGNGMIHEYSSSKTNLYPIQSGTKPTLNIASNLNNNAFGSTANCNNNYQQIQNISRLPAQIPFEALQHTSNNSPNTRSQSILTICAGTQTDGNLGSNSSWLQDIPPEYLSTVASKSDVDSIRQILDELKIEQQRIVKMLETILEGNHLQMVESNKTQYRDIAIQADFIENSNPTCVKECAALEPTNNIVQTPKGKPIAHSTTYRPNSPQAQHMKHNLILNKPDATLTKSASDTSIAMNELALKYLPNEKLSELLKELNMDCPLEKSAPCAPNTPGIPINEFEKRPSDISNASYKYLKKYRLLPADHEENGNNSRQEVILGDNENNIPKYNSPLYSNIRNTPTNHRQQRTIKCSPYASRLPLSPLARGSSPPLQSAVHLVNLDNIKHQPKFL